MEGDTGHPAPDRRRNMGGVVPPADNAVVIRGDARRRGHIFLPHDRGAILNYMERTKNEMDDFVINGELTIEELYELAKKEGFEKRTLFFSIKNVKTGQHFSTHHVVDFGKGWTKDSAIMHLTWEDLPHSDACPG